MRKFWSIFVVVMLSCAALWAQEGDVCVPEGGVEVEGTEPAGPSIGTPVDDSGMLRTPTTSPQSVTTTELAPDTTGPKEGQTLSDGRRVGTLPGKRPITQADIKAVREEWQKLDRQATAAQRANGLAVKMSGISARTARRIANEVAGAAAESAENRARKHADAVAAEAIRKAGLDAQQRADAANTAATAAAKSYTDKAVAVVAENLRGEIQKVAQPAKRMAWVALLIAIAAVAGLVFHWWRGGHRRCTMCRHPWHGSYACGVEGCICCRVVGEEAPRPEPADVPVVEDGDLA